jgi:DNA-binding PadR family transcriptional regulator
MDTKTLCLGIISGGGASGYEIKKTFEEGGLSHIYHTSYGSIYPALTALTHEGLVDCAEMAQEKRPDKKVYTITAAGRAALEKALSMPPAEDKFRSDFLFILFFAHFVPPARIAMLIDQRIAWYEDHLEKMTSPDHCGHVSAGEKFVHNLGVAIYSSAAEYLRTNRQLLLEQISHPAQQVAE